MSNMPKLHLLLAILCSSFQSSPDKSVSQTSTLIVMLSQVKFESLLCPNFSEFMVICCHSQVFSIAALYSPRRAARLHLAR